MVVSAVSPDRFLAVANGLHELGQEHALCLAGAGAGVDLPELDALRLDDHPISEADRLTALAQDRGR